MKRLVALAGGSIGVLGLGVIAVAIGQAAAPTPSQVRVAVESDSFAFPCASKLSGTAQYEYVRGDDSAEQSLRMANASVLTEWPDATMQKVVETDAQVTARFDSYGTQIGYVLVNRASDESGWRIEGMRVCTPQ